MLEVVRIQIFKVINKGKPPQMFSLACNLTKNDIELLPIDISLKKVSASNIDFSTREITLKKVYRNNVVFRPVKLRQKKYVKTT